MKYGNLRFYIEFFEVFRNVVFVFNIVVFVCLCEFIFIYDDIVKIYIELVK